MSAATIQLGPGRPARPLRRDARPRRRASPGSVVAVGLGFLAPRVETALSGAGWEATGSESVAARALIQQQFAGNASSGLMVVAPLPDADALTDPAFAAVTRRGRRDAEGRSRRSRA